MKGKGRRGVYGLWMTILAVWVVGVAGLFRFQALNRSAFGEEFVQSLVFNKGKALELNAHALECNMTGGVIPVLEYAVFPHHGAFHGRQVGLSIGPEDIDLWRRVIAFRYFFMGFQYQVLEGKPVRSNILHRTDAFTHRPQDGNGAVRWKIADMPSVAHFGYWALRALLVIGYWLGAES